MTSVPIRFDIYGKQREYHRALE